MANFIRASERDRGLVVGRIADRIAKGLSPTTRHGKIKTGHIIGMGDRRGGPGESFYQPGDEVRVVSNIASWGEFLPHPIRNAPNLLVGVYDFFEGGDIKVVAKPEVFEDVKALAAAAAKEFKLPIEVEKGTPKRSKEYAKP